MDGFTTATDRVLTSQDANYVIAGTNIAQTFSATQTFDSHIRFGTHNTWEIGTNTVRPSVVFAMNADFAPGGVPGTYTNVRKLNIWDANAAGPFWDVQATAGTTADFWVRDQAGSRLFRGQRLFLSSPVNRTYFYSDFLPARRQIVEGDAVDDSVNPKIGLSSDRWFEGWFESLDTNYLFVVS